LVSGRANSRDVSAIRALAARESRSQERTASLSHLILCDDMMVVIESTNRRLTELADLALRTMMWRLARARSPRLVEAVRARDEIRWNEGALTTAAAS